jgi:hypothetical protein
MGKQAIITLIEKPGEMNEVEAGWRGEMRDEPLAVVLSKC